MTEQSRLDQATEFLSAEPADESRQREIDRIAVEVTAKTVLIRVENGAQ